MQFAEKCAQNMQKTYIMLVYKSAGVRFASRGIKVVLAGAGSTAVMLQIHPRILAPCQLLLQNRPSLVDTLQS